MYINMILLNFHFFKLVSALSAFTHRRDVPDSPYGPLLELHLNMAMPHLYWRASNFQESLKRIQHSRCALTVLSKGEHHLPQLAGSAVSSAGQDADGHLCHKGALLAHVRLDVHRNTQLFSCRAAF